MKRVEGTEHPQFTHVHPDVCCTGGNFIKNMEAMRAIRIISAIALFGFSVVSAVPAAADTTNDCHIGSYSLSDGRAIDIAPSDGDTLRWRMFPGQPGP